METELIQKIEGHLESIAGSLKVMAERTATPSERRLEKVFAAILVNSAQEPDPTHALQLALELEGLMQDISSQSVPQ